MSSQDLLNGYDMVVALTQKFLNSQLASITEPVPDPTVQPPPPTGANTDYPILNSFTVQLNPDADAGSNEAYPSIVVNQMSAPTVAIKANSQVDFTLHILDGVVQYIDLSAAQQTVSLDGVDLTFTVDMSLATVEDVNDLDATSASISQLQGFTSSDFTIQFLALEFESSKMISTFNVSMADGSDSNYSKTSRQYLTLVNCLTIAYGSDDGDGTNPYIFGYPISSTSSTDTGQTDTDEILPAFVPTSCEFSTTVNADSAALSTLNYCLMTNDNPFPTEASRGVFNEPWVTDASSSGMMTVSRDLFVNSYLLTQVLPQIRTALGDTDSVSVWANPNDSNTWELYLQETNSDQNDGKGRFVNAKKNLDYYLLENYQMWSTATLSNVDGNMTITAACKFEFYAKADVEIQLTNWIESTITQFADLTLTYDAGNKGQLTVTPNVTIGHPVGAEPTMESDMGTAAKIGGSVMSVWDSMTGSGSTPMEKMQSSLGDVEGNLTDAFQTNVENFMGVLNNQFVLPAGDVFNYNNIAFNSEDDMQVTISDAS